ncbi:hypothetical protein [Pseudomonas sp. KNUC1026]|uniref:hypothetical protein n=1 Tax=Pseudomonas sp. KNUC1026 TaxID=2893890 RepID=UPI001F34D4E8|nr:hypothetical protein [Pseudomonas sp. KNUC1026]UFH50995.1 hypothetical protein LN139_07970 [Pseudomonas sp. KNUC1026]
MIDYRTEHRCLLSEVASKRLWVRSRPGRTVQALILAGFLTLEQTADSAGEPQRYLQLTAAGHRYLGGLWY